VGIVGYVFGGLVALAVLMARVLVVVSRPTARATCASDRC